MYTLLKKAAGSHSSMTSQAAYTVDTEESSWESNKDSKKTKVAMSSWDSQGNQSQLLYSGIEDQA